MWSPRLECWHTGQASKSQIKVVLIMETWRCINCGKKRDYENGLIMIMCKCGFFMNNESKPDKIGKGKIKNE